MKRYETYILKASGQIREKLAEPSNSITVPDVYKGYIASFASSIRQSGLIAAISFYTSTSTTKKTTDYRRNCLMQALLQIVATDAPAQPLINYTLEKVYNGIRLDKFPLTLKRKDDTVVEPDHDALQILQAKIEDAAIALKLALRSFDLQKTNSDD